MLGADIPGPTARRFLTVLRTNDVLKELVPSAGRRAALWVFPDLLNLAEGRKRTHDRQGELGSRITAR